MTQKEAFSELKKAANLAYDDRIVNILISVLEEESEDNNNG
jgi:HD-GYP domain-containing protein (c-di-GMP phosphodiesterase class II)